MDQLDTQQYLVTIDDDAARHYAEMRSAEDQWLDECKQAGCHLVRSQRRQAVVLVPPGVQLPDIDTSFYQKWAEIAAVLAAEQGKCATVGSRSSQPPTWLNLDGSRAPLSDPPDYRVQRLRYRTAQAARGARMSADDAIVYVNGLIERANARISSSQQHGHKKRLPAQRERLTGLQHDLRHLQTMATKARLNDQLISVQVLSGDGWRITARTTDRHSIHGSITTIRLMPCVTNPTIEPAGTRQRQSSAVDSVTFETARLRLSLYDKH